MPDENGDFAFLGRQIEAFYGQLRSTVHSVHADYGNSTQ
jgi:hypothetical protein